MSALTQYISSRSWRSTKWRLSGNLNSFSFREGREWQGKVKIAADFEKNLQGCD